MPEDTTSADLGLRKEQADKEAAEKEVDTISVGDEEPKAIITGEKEDDKDNDDGA